MRIIAKGTRIRCFVNGELATDYEGTGVLDDADHTTHNVGTSGHIALQLHTVKEMSTPCLDRDRVTDALEHRSFTEEELQKIEHILDRQDG